MKDLVEFFLWNVVGMFIALIYIVYEKFWLSPRGLDKVSQSKKNMIDY